MIARALTTLALLSFPFLPTPAPAQTGTTGSSPWSVRIRAVISGDSHDSEPTGYKIYSGLALEAGVVRRVGDVVSMELSVRAESREVEGPTGDPHDHRLGSLEMLPVTLTALWRPRGRGGADLQPYLGAGINVTGTWEKSGALDSANLAPTVGPALQLGTDYALSDRTVLNLDVRWHTMTVEIEDFASPVPSVQIDPLILGLGVGVRF